jgi:hypothetical protein
MRRKPKQDTSRKGDDVNHYSLTEWTDFARHLSTASQNEQMRKHLSTCQVCKDTAEIFESVADFAQRETSYSPPEEVVRVAKSYIAPLTMAKSGSKQFVLASLTFDSFRSAVVEGLRGLQEAPRQLLYISGDTVVDLRIEADSGSDRIQLGGQVLSSQWRSVDLNEIPVELVSGTETVATTATNQFGEFQLTLTTGKRLQLLFGLQTGTLAVQIPEA